MWPTIHPDAPPGPEPPRRVAVQEDPGGAKSEWYHPVAPTPRWGQIKVERWGHLRVLQPSRSRKISYSSCRCSWSDARNTARSTMPTYSTKTATTAAQSDTNQVAAGPSLASSWRHTFT